jgi:hypothetical protein
VSRNVLKQCTDSAELWHQQEERISWYARKHRLYALGGEELLVCMARAVFRAC